MRTSVWSLTGWPAVHDWEQLLPLLSLVSRVYNCFQKRKERERAGMVNTRSGLLFLSARWPSDTDSNNTPRLSTTAGGAAAAADSSSAQTHTRCSCLSLLTVPSSHLVHSRVAAGTSVRQRTLRSCDLSCTPGDEPAAAGICEFVLGFVCSEDEGNS